MELKNWSEEDLEQLDAKFDALTEHLGLEFVFERVSDGSDVADRERVYVRPKIDVVAQEVKELAETKKEPEPLPMQPTSYPEPYSNSYLKKKRKGDIGY